nr:hypothetical protein Iba_chr11aCG15690 [Ipomoea batatas]
MRFFKEKKIFHEINSTPPPIGTDHQRNLLIRKFLDTNQIPFPDGQNSIEGAILTRRGESKLREEEKKKGKMRTITTVLTQSRGNLDGGKCGVKRGKRRAVGLLEFV